MNAILKPGEFHIKGRATIRRIIERTTPVAVSSDTADEQLLHLLLDQAIHLMNEGLRGAPYDRGAALEATVETDECTITIAWKKARTV